MLKTDIKNWDSRRSQFAVFILLGGATKRVMRRNLPPQSSIWTFSTTTALISTILRALERCCVGEVHRKKRKVEYKYRNIINTTVTMTENFWEIGSMVLFNFWKTCSHASNMMQRLVFLWDFDAVDGQIAYAAAGCSKPAVTRARDRSRRGQQLCWRFNHQQRRNL